MISKISDYKSNDKKPKSTWRGPKMRPRHGGGTLFAAAVR